MKKVKKNSNGEGKTSYSTLSTTEVLDNSLENNKSLVQKVLKNDETIIFKDFERQDNPYLKFCLIFVEGMINNEILNRDVISPILNSSPLEYSNIISVLQNSIILCNLIKKTSDIDSIIEAIFGGNTALFVDGSNEVLIISAKGLEMRAIEEPETEKIIHGSKEGFNESIAVNISLIRRRLKTPNLKFKFRTFGSKSRTKACICYIEGISDEKILNELNKRLDFLNIDGLTDSGYIQEIIRDSPFSPFETIGNTERPDVVAGKLLEGRIAIIVDGTPFVLTLPFMFIEYFQSSEDYNVNYYYATINRILRYASFVITTCFCAVYLALVTFHQETIPTPLLFSITAARQDIPFPSVIEIIILLVVFEILRETGIRTPTYIGQTLSIVGALVLGQAAVQARFVSAPIVIIVAIAGITGLILPKMKGAIIFLRFTYLILASVLGLYGFIFALLGTLIHLFGMQSFGVPYMYNYYSLKIKDIKDTAIRVPLWYSKYRAQIPRINRTRLSKGDKS